MGTLQNVVIPVDHFAKQVTNIYSKPLEAMVREIVQNSKDAGATKLEINIEENKIIFSDNGCGMTEEVLKAGMLTMSGSVKKEGDTGGFGAAKELILFAQESYEIETNDIYAYGSCLSYMLDKKEFVRGTKISIVPHTLFNYKASDFYAKTVSFVEQCYFDMKIYVNGKHVYQNRIGELYRELDWATIYSSSEEEETKHMKIMHNGILMFKKYVDPMKTHLVIDIKGKSTEALTTSRDNLKYSYEEELQKLTLEIQKSQGNFGRLYNMITTYRGAKSFIEILRKTHTEEEINEVLSYVPEVAQTNIISEQAQLIQEKILSLSIPEEVKERLKAAKITVEADLAEDFKVRIDKKGYDEVPSDLKPNSMKKKYEVIACMWKAALQIIGEGCSYMPRQYNIGFILSDDAEAMFTRDNGEICFYINPYSKKFNNCGSDIESVHQLVITACHEIAHAFTKWHDETWQEEFQNTLCSFFVKSNISAVRTLARKISL